jgi:ankyrin repeat protein
VGRGADLEVSDVNNMTALHWAGERGYLETAKALIRAKVGAHTYDDSVCSLSRYCNPVALIWLRAMSRMPRTETLE